MPHAFIGYAGSTLRAAEMYDETFPDEPMTVLVDYFAREVTDTLTCCRRFPRRAAAGQLSVRLDTPGGRFIEGRDPPQSSRSEERRGGKRCVSTCRSRGSPYRLQKKTQRHS